jgi:hypothetical protein
MIAFAFEANITHMHAARKLRCECAGKPRAQIFIQQQLTSHGTAQATVNSLSRFSRSAA